MQSATPTPRDVALRLLPRHGAAVPYAGVLHRVGQLVGVNVAAAALAGLCCEGVITVSEGRVVLGLAPTKRSP